MSRPRLIAAVIVLALAHIFVMSNIAALFFTAGSEAFSRVTTTRTPTVGATPVPSGAAPTVAVVPTLVPTPPEATPSETPAASPTATATPGPSGTPTPTATRSLAGFPACAANPPFKYPCVYTVKPGDALTVVAARFKVALAKLMAANGLSDPDLIRIGQVLLIPDPNQ